LASLACLGRVAPDRTRPWLTPSSFRSSPGIKPRMQRLVAGQVIALAIAERGPPARAGAFAAFRPEHLRAWLSHTATGTAVAAPARRSAAALCWPLGWTTAKCRFMTLSFPSSPAPFGGLRGTYWPPSATHFAPVLGLAFADKAWHSGGLATWDNGFGNHSVQHRRI